jgi:phage terminase large subunit-like protein
VGRVKSRGQRNIDWIEKHCRIPEGKFVGQPVRLRAWQKREIKKIYDNPHGTRTAILSFGRKNAKTTLSAFLLLLSLAGPESRPNSQLVSTALSRDQAALLFDLAAKMVRMSPTLNDYVGVRYSNKHLYCEGRGTVYRALSADASTNVGSSPVFAVHDELGQVKGPRSLLFEAVETGMGAHENPLSIIISTQASSDSDLLSVIIDDALAGHDPRVTCTVYSAPMEDDPFLVKTIRKANPAYGDFLNAEEVKKSAHDAKRMPSREVAYRNLILNQRIDAKSVFVTPTIWQQNNGKVKDFGRALVYGGLDLSATNDLTALVLCAEVDNKWQIKPTFWLPGNGLSEKSQVDRVPYDMWASQGYLQTTPGAAIEYAWIAHQLRKVFDEYNIAKIAFDRWNWKFLKPWLVDVGFKDHELNKFDEFGQGYVSMSPALRQLESALLEQRMCHGDHPVLKMCAANAVVQSDPAGNRKLAKDKSSGRIDGMVALAMAIGVTDAEPQTYVTGRLRTV